MSKGIKCIIRQDWTNRDAAGNLIERRTAVYVTDEDGTPTVYPSIKEARAEIISNFGYAPNRNGILHSHNTNDITGSTHDGYVRIIREDEEEYAEAIEQADRDRTAATEPEQTKSNIIVYATEPVSNTSGAELEVQEWETVLVQIMPNETVNPRTSERHTNGYRANVFVVSQFGNLSTYYGLESYGRTAEECRQAADNMLEKHFSRRTSKVVATGSKLEDMHASLTDEAVHERFKEWTASLFATEPADQSAIVEAAMSETDDAMNKAFEALRKTEDAAIEYDTDAAIEYAANARRAAERAETAAKKVMQLDYTVSYVPNDDAFSARAYAYQATETAAFSVIETTAADNLKEYGNAEDATNATAYGAFEQVHGTRPDTDDADQMDELDRLMKHAAEAVEDAAEDAAARAAFATRPAADLSKYAGMPYLQTEPAPAETYQRAELLDYLGDATAYDLAAIETEATETDPATGRQVWRRGADLAAIAEKNELAAYYPATA